MGEILVMGKSGRRMSNKDRGDKILHRYRCDLRICSIQVARLKRFLGLAKARIGEPNFFIELSGIRTCACFLSSLRAKHVENFVSQV